MSNELNSIDIQAEQIKLARETTKVLLTGCPQEMSEVIDTCFARVLEKAQLRVAHLVVCVYDETSQSCACGLVSSGKPV